MPADAGGLAAEGIPSATRACSAISAPAPTPSAVSACRLLRPLGAFLPLRAFLPLGTPPALFTFEVLCPVSTSRKIVPSSTCLHVTVLGGRLSSSPSEEVLTVCLRGLPRLSRRRLRAVIVGSGQCTRRPRSPSDFDATLPGSVVARLPLSV